MDVNPLAVKISAGPTGATDLLTDSQPQVPVEAFEASHAPNARRDAGEPGPAPLPDHPHTGPGLKTLAEKSRMGQRTRGFGVAFVDLQTSSAEHSWFVRWYLFLDKRYCNILNQGSIMLKGGSIDISWF